MKKLTAIFATALALSLKLIAADEDGFVPLFNGKDTTGWHLRREKGHNSWSIEPGGVLKNTVKTGEHGTLIKNIKRLLT